MAQPAPPRMTVREFLAYDDDTDTRYELVNGELVPIGPSAEPHVRITASVFLALEKRLKRPCRAYSGGGVFLVETDDTWRRPDLFVSCVEGEGFSRRPRLVVEVLSPSTEKEDRTARLDFYKSFPSLETVLLVWQDTRRVELHEREAEGWRVRDAIGSGTIALSGLGLELPLEELYA